jgi:hypothetical protein
MARLWLTCTPGHEGAPEERSNLVKLNTPGGNNENTLATCPRRFGNQVCFANLRSNHDPQLHAVVDAIDKTFDDSQNSGDSAQIIAVFAKDGCCDQWLTDFQSGGDHETLHQSIQGGEIQQ